MRLPRILLGANRNPFVPRQHTSALNAGNSYIRPKASTFIGYGSTRIRIKQVSVFDNLKAFPFVISLAKMHQSRKRTKPSLGSLATATFVLVAVANFPVLRFVANTGRARAVILLPKSVLVANLWLRRQLRPLGHWILRRNLARITRSFSYRLRSEGRPGPFIPV